MFAEYRAFGENKKLKYRKIAKNWKIYSMVSCPFKNFYLKVGLLHENEKIKIRLRLAKRNNREN